MRSSLDVHYLRCDPTLAGSAIRTFRQTACPVFRTFSLEAAGRPLAGYAALATSGQQQPTAALLCISKSSKQAKGLRGGMLQTGHTAGEVNTQLHCLRNRRSGWDVKRAVVRAWGQDHSRMLNQYAANASRSVRHSGKAMPSKLERLGGIFMKSAIVKRSIVVAGHKTSVSLEDAFWNGLKEIVRERHMTLSELVAEIAAQRQLGNLSSALRLFVLDFYRTQLFHPKEGRDENHEIIGYAAPAFP